MSDDDAQLKLSDIDIKIQKSKFKIVRTIKYQNTSTAEIKKVIGSLKAKDSRGYDEISVKILKLSSPFISSPLNYICNKLLSSRIFWNFPLQVEVCRSCTVI